MQDRRPVVYGDGLQTRDFTYVEDVVKANVLACLAPNISGEVINIACGMSYSLLDLVDALNRVLGKSIEPIFEAERPGDIKHSQADISKAKKLLDFSPEVTFEEGLEKLAHWFNIQST